MDNVKNIIAILISIFILVATFKPIILGLPMGLFVMGLGGVLFVMSGGFNKSLKESSNRGELFGITAFLLGLYFMHSVGVR